MRQLFGIDVLGKSKGAMPIKNMSLADKLNDKGWDIYWTVNVFNPPDVRRITNLKLITTIAFEIDAQSVEKFNKSIYPMPSMIVKTKNGFHIYYELSDPIDCTYNPQEWGDWYREFIQNRIEKRFGSDPSAKDAARILRVPMMRYWKDKKGETIITITHESDIKYTLKQLEIAFPIVTKKEFTLPKEIKARDGTGFWERASTLPVKECLEKLSGTGYVSGEKYTFKREKDTVRVYIDGVRRNAWIDKDGKIGSMRGLGPSITNWLYVHNRNWKTVAEIIKKEFGVRDGTS